MNKVQHFLGGLVLFLIIILILDKLSLNHWMGFALALLIGSILPDIIEPAKHPFHRKYFHGKRFLKILSITLIITLILGIFINQFLYLTFLALGYILHLALDSTTPFGLPK